MLIRNARLEDSDQIFDLVKGFATSFKPEKTAFENSFAALLHDDSVYISIAEHDNNIIGYILGFVHSTFFANGNVAWLEEIMIDEKYRRMGVGTELVKQFEETAKEKQCKLVALATRRAANFYSAIGYEESAAYFRKIL